MVIPPLSENTTGDMTVHIKLDGPNGDRFETIKDKLTGELGDEPTEITRNQGLTATVR